MTCNEPDGPRHQAGRRVYNTNCYFCHGYSGDAQTVAAGLLDPPPRSFQNSGGLSRVAVLNALNEGRPGTAMRSFRRTLDREEVAAVADFVLREFVLCQRNNTFYHTTANGWPDHEERYGAAYPFVLGTMKIDNRKSALDQRQRAGLALYREGCVICHDSFAITATKQRAQLEWQDVETTNDVPGTTPSHSGKLAQEHAEEEDHHSDDDHEYEYSSPHDIAPELADLTPAERRGEALYQAACTQCHAADGTAENWIGRFLEPQPTAFTRSEDGRKLDDAALKGAIIDGVSNSSMPAFRSVLNEQDIDDIIAYLRRAFLGP